MTSSEAKQKKPYMVYEKRCSFYFRLLPRKIEILEISQQLKDLRWL